MICAIMIGRANSQGFPGKNITKVLGRYLCEYPLIAAKKSKYIKKIFVSTDCPVISRVSRKHGAILLNRPKYLATNKALGDHVYEDAYFKIKKLLKKQNIKIKLVVLLMANAPTISQKLIDKGIKILNKNPSFDSAVTTSIYNMWSPLRARKLDKKKTLKPFVPFNTFGNPKTLNCDRDSQGDVFFADMSVSIVRPHCLEKLKDGLLPQKWMGKNIAPIHSWGGCDVDYKWQIPSVEFWLKEHGYKKRR
tara:strand:+ start:2521 stop:3267 length:747 start_codon:yes stop_codon:yes gene_type:complete